MSGPDKTAQSGSREGELLVGKYRLNKRLGAGGMGEVYRAQNELIGRDVAIKLMRAEHARNEEIVERFMREARAANLVRHPNVVDVVDVGKDDHGIPFIVQELLEGRDLASVLDRRGGLPHDEAVSILLPVIEAIGFAHTRGVVHRDIKPDNIFLSETSAGVVAKVLDFGISKIDTPDARRVTATGVSMGTPAYMSPEQIQGANGVDARSDVWSLGVMMHEVLTGVLPFKGDTYGALFVQICTADAIPLQSVLPDVPPALAKVVSRCLRRDLAERYASAAELARDLRAVVDGRVLEPTRKLAALVVSARQDALGDDLKPSSRAAEAPTLADLPNGQGPKFSTTVPDRPAPERPPPVRASGVTDSGVVPAVESTPPQPPARSSPRPVLLVLGAVALLGIAGAAIALRSASHPTTSSARPSASADPRASTANPLVSSPPSALPSAPTELPSIAPSASAAAAASAAPSAPAESTAGAAPGVTSAPNPRATARPRGNDPHPSPSARASAGAHAVPTATPSVTPSATPSATPPPAAPTSSSGRPLHGTDQYE